MGKIQTSPTGSIRSLVRAHQEAQTSTAAPSQMMGPLLSALDFGDRRTEVVDAIDRGMMLHMMSHWGIPPMLELPQPISNDPATADDIIEGPNRMMSIKSREPS
ncbi:hypothetical protein Salat_2543100 [Sesamum alatum]|uniref:Uncharacterized protein n=1 Tax=Sesamum alatum TaxID=300844 RepID=A0AAE1XSH2_9LAMI|nr:hypothetical protein Salat_2543100 [Sesamum alatum]